MISESMGVIELKGLPNSFRRLIEQSEAEGHHFLSKMKSEWDCGRNCFDQSGEALYGIVANQLIVAICGRNIDPYLDNTEVGRLRHLYVHPDYRRKGLGRRLVHRALKDGENFFVRIRLRTDNEASSIFYSSLGFSEVHNDEYATHMWIY